MSDVEVSNDISISNIMFKGKSLSYWQNIFTIQLNSGGTNQEIQRTLSEVHNKYHLVYNNYNELLVAYSNIEKQFNVKRGLVIKEIVDEWKENGVSGRVPAKEILSEMAISKDDNLKTLHSQLVMIELIKTFFENNKIKLEKTMQLVINMSFMVNASDKVQVRSLDYE